MSHVERVLWRIAELGARCSQQGATGGRGALWEELEETITKLDASFEAARQATDIAPAQVRNLEGRLKVALAERDREKARVKEQFEDAEAARRERDRERAKARKAMAAAVAARNVAAEAKAAAAEAEARATAAEAAADQALAARDEAVAALEKALATGEDAADARDAALAARDEAVAARDKAVLSRHTTLRALEAAEARIAELEAALAAAEARRDEAVDTLAARAEGTVVVLPGVPLPEASAEPPAPPARVSWQPTWSEWANPETADAAAPAPAPAPAPLVDTADTADTADSADAEFDAELAAFAGETDLTDGTAVAEDVVLPDSEAEDGGVRYLNVAATIGQLLPEDLGPLLMAGATVVRREGRLYAIVAVQAHERSGAAQAERFSTAGFKVDWSSSAPLGV